MKTIFRYTNVGLLMAAIFAVGAMVGFAQDPCADNEALTALGDKFRAEYPGKTIPERKKAINTGKEYLEKYGNCKLAEDMADYLKTTLPKMETKVKEMEEAEYKAALLKRFDSGMTGKNWDEVYASGKEILQKYGTEYQDVVLVLGSIGLDETAKLNRVTKWNDDTLRFARQSIQDLEAGKKFTNFGVSIKGGANFQYDNKEDALGWMNYTIGYILFYDKKDKKQGLSHLYKATQAASDTKAIPVIYQAIGEYYFDETKKLAGEVEALAKTQNPEDAEEVAKQKVEAIKAKVAMVNGTSEAAIDAYARAFDLAKKTTPASPKAYTDKLFETLQTLYNVRFGKTEGFDAFIANTIKKPLPDPLNPVTPISDPEPSTTTTSTTPAPSATPGKPKQ